MTFGKRIFLGALLASVAAHAQTIQSSRIVNSDGSKTASVTAAGTPGANGLAVQGVTGGTPIPVSGSLSVSGTADLAGNTATYNANNVCSAVITAGEQSVGFHLTAGTLDATLTPYITNQIGAINCATAGTCTATAFSSGNTIVVTNPSGVKDVGVNLLGGVRQVQVCTTTWNSGSASGVVTATFVQAASSGGGSSTVNVSQLNGTTTDTNSGSKSAGTLRVVLATDQPALTNKLLVTPDSVALPANQSVNAAQLAGTTTDTNSGSKSAGTLRVVLATDQPALTNKLLVTPDSVALPANQSTNVNQLAGTTTDTNSGSKSAGTLRVVLATDQPALTNKLLVTPDSVALPANQSVNLSQVAGATTVVGHGVAAAALRVELPTDGTGVVGLNAGANTIGSINNVSGTVSLPTGAATEATLVKLPVAQGSTTSGQSGPLVQGAVTTSPPTYTTGQTSPLSLDPAGSLRIAPGGTASVGNTPKNGDPALVVTLAPGSIVFPKAPTDVAITDGNRRILVKGPAQPASQQDPAVVVQLSPTPSIACPLTLGISQTASTQLVTGLAGKRIFICTFVAISTTAQSIALTEGTGTTCGTGATALVGSTTVANGVPVAVTGGWVEVAATPQTVTQVNGDNLCLLQSGAGLVAGKLTYVQF